MSLTRRLLTAEQVREMDKRLASELFHNQCGFDEEWGCIISFVLYL